MKALTITFHTAKNYGAVLQCYAFQRALSEYVDYVETIDFSTAEMRYSILPKGRGVKNWVRKILTLKDYSAIKKKFERYDIFVSEYLSLTEHYDSIDALKNNPPDADIIFTGSDQVFNPNRRANEREAYYLNFPCSYRASYAASFGGSQLPEKRKTELSAYINTFDSISVRERYAVDMVKKLGWKKDIFQTIDPVFLLNISDWTELEEEYHGLPEHYILFFNLRESNTSIRIVQELSKKTGLPIVMITGKPNIPFKCKYVLRDVGPRQYLWLIHHCSYFIEDSFHATAFSMIYHKQFLFCDDHQKSNERGRALLDLAGLSQAYMYNEWKERLFTQYNYELVDEKFALERRKALQYIETCINNAKH